MNFLTVFHTPPIVSTQAPGRVNLLGEHTDYNDGFVLPTAIPQHTIASIGFSPDTQHHFYSAELAEKVDLSATTSQTTTPQTTGFASYILGCIQVVEQAGYAVPALNIFVTSSVPIGAGLSSSAALEIAVLRGLRSLLHLDLDDVELAQLGQQAEIQYTGVQCGIMDQMACSLAEPGDLLFLDTRSLDRQVLRLPEASELLVIDSGIPRTLATSGYNQRRAECEQAAALLGVTALRDISNLAALAGLPDLLQRRARHVVSENHRVLEAAAGVSAERFGQLMNASHASLRDDYEVSIADLDQLVDRLQRTAGVWGARLTGAGFGGACVALVETGKAMAIGQQVLEPDQSIYSNRRILVPSIAT